MNYIVIVRHWSASPCSPSPSLLLYSVKVGMTTDDSLEGLVQTSLSSIESDSLHKEINTWSSNTLRPQIHLNTLNVVIFNFEKLHKIITLALPLSHLSFCLYLLLCLGLSRAIFSVLLPQHWRGAFSLPVFFLKNIL